MGDGDQESYITCMSDIYDAGDLEYNNEDENDAYDDQDDEIVSVVEDLLLDDTTAPLTQTDRQRLQGFIDPNPLTSPPDEESDVGKRKKR